jgi:hypothetical protein
MNLCCPYCGEEVKVPDESNEPEVPHEAQCCHCLMNFIFYTEWYPSYFSSMAPCLNGGTHDYQQRTGVPKEYFVNKYRCSYCGNEETLVKAEVKA